MTAPAFARKGAKGRAIRRESTTMEKVSREDEVNKRVDVSATVTVPAEHPARSLSITGTPTPSTAPSVPQQPVAQQKAVPSQLIRYAAAVLEGQSDMLEGIARCFVNDPQIKKHDSEGWILESSEFASCTTGEQIFPIADDIVSRVNSILALYCGATSTFSVQHIYWVNAEGKPLRQIRGSMCVNVFSSKGLAQLRSIRGIQPLGSAVLQTMIINPVVREALSLHGESELSWSQVYDIIEFVDADGIVKAGYATRKKIDAVRQTANHYRHLGNPKNCPLPSNPPTLALGTEFARNLLRRWISDRL
jgi:hypothetical protein